jgi:uncharacterized surface anchored protein
MIKSKTFKIIITVLMLCLQFFFITLKVNAANIGEIKDIERGELGYYCIQKWNGSKWIYLTYNQTFYTDTDGQRYLAYCLSPGNPGVGYVQGEKDSYSVKISKILDDDIIWRVLKNGYPNKTVEELGVETEDDAYFATMQAINAILRGYTLEQAKELYKVGQFAINGENYDDVQRRGNKTLNALINLIEIGLNGTETRKQYLNISINAISELVNENDKFYSQTFSIKSSAEILSFKIDKIEGLPGNSYVSDTQGNKKEIFSSGEDFKVMIPKEGLEDEIKGKISIKAKQKNYPVYYGESQIEGYQDYALCNNSYSEVSMNVEIYAPLNKSKLIISKVDSETGEKISGVKFEIECADGTKNTYITDENGKIIISNQRPGIVTIKEIETIDGYVLNQEEMKVKLEFNDEKKVEIKNEKIKVIEQKKEQNKEIVKEENTVITKKLPKTGENRKGQICIEGMLFCVLFGMSFFIKIL